MIESIAILTSLFASFILALFVLLKNPKSINYVLFFSLTVSFIIFSLINYVSLHPVFYDQLFWIRLDTVAGAWAFYLTYVTVDNFPRDKLHVTRAYKVGLVFTLLLSVLSLSPLVFTRLESITGSTQPVPGPAISLLLIHHLTVIVASVVVANKKYRKADRIQRNQLNLILSGLAITLVTIVVFNFIFVQVLRNTSFVSISSFAILAFASALVYAIVRHRFLEISLIVARSVGYVLFLASIALVFSAVLFLASSLVPGAGEISINLQVFFALATLVVAICAQPLRRLINSTTKKVFFRDAYEPQVFLDQLNQVLVSKIEIEPLLQLASHVIETNLKSSYCVFGIRRTSYFPRRVVGTLDKEVDESDIRLIRDNIKHIKERVILTDMLDVDQIELQRKLSKHEAAVVVRLVSTTDYDLEGIGYLVLGSKKSGNLYSKQDKQIIDIIANELVIAIQNALRFEEIEQFNVTLQEKIDEATSQLKRTNKKLKSLDETKDEFISMASHQLRTPLTSVKGYLSMVLEKDAGELNAMQEQLLNQAFVSSQRMVYLIADLLNVSRLKTGKFILDAHPANLADIIEGELSQLTETVKSKNMTLTYNKPENFPILTFDETKIRQVIMNFVDNAIYYTPNGGKIRVELKDTGNTIEFKVIDNGLGVPKSDQPHLFGKFYRAGNARKARPDGTGLGLFMAKKVIAASGGAIIFESEEGKGSTFGFSFAKSRLALAESTEHAAR